MHIISQKKRFSGIYKTRKIRHAAAMVELALCLPVLTLLVLGGIESAHFIHLKQNLTICAYEAAKIAAQENATMANTTERFEEIASAKGIAGASISYATDFSASTISGTEITVQVIAPAGSNYQLPIDYFKNRTLGAEVTMVRQQF